MNAKDAYRLARDAPLPDLVRQELEIIFELIRLAASEGKLSIHLTWVSPRGDVELSKAGYLLMQIAPSNILLLWGHQEKHNEAAPAS